MKHLLVLITCGISTLVLYGQSFKPYLSEQYMGMGTYSRNSSDVFSFNANSASLAGIKQLSAGICATEQYMLNDLKSYSAVIAAPVASGCVGVSLDYDGDVDAGRSKLSLGYSKKLSASLSLGAQLNYSNLRFAGYKKLNLLSADVSVYITVTEKLVTGVQIVNVHTLILTKGRTDNTDGALKAGIGYELSANLLLVCQISKGGSLPLETSPGIQYNFMRIAFLRFGVSLTRGSYFAGFGLTWRNVRLDLSATCHQRLGYSPVLMIIINPRTSRPL